MKEHIYEVLFVIVFLVLTIGVVVYDSIDPHPPTNQREDVRIHGFE